MHRPSVPRVGVSALLLVLLVLLLLQQDEAFILGSLRPITAPTAASISPAAARRLTTQVRATPDQVRLPDLSQTAFPEKFDDEPYDLIVLGSGPAGETAGCKAAQLGQKVAIIEIKKAFGGPTGLTSKAVREAAKRILKTVDQVGGDRMKQIKRLWGKRFPTLKSEAEVYQAAETRERLMKNDCDLYIGSAFLVNDTWDPDKYVRRVRKGVRHGKGRQSCCQCNQVGLKGFDDSRIGLLIQPHYLPIC